MDFWNEVVEKQMTFPLIKQENLVRRRKLYLFLQINNTLCRLHPTTLSWFMLPETFPDLVWISWILPGHVEHVSDLLRQADAGAAVCCDVDARDAALPRHLGSSQKQNVLLRSKWAYLVSDIIAYDYDLTSCWILGGSQSHPPRHHANLHRQIDNLEW